MGIKTRMFFGDEDEISPQLKTAFENLDKFVEGVKKLKTVFQKMDDEIKKAPNNVEEPLSQAFEERNKIALAEIENLGKLALGLDKAFANRKEFISTELAIFAKALKTEADDIQNSLQKALSIGLVIREFVERKQKLIAGLDEFAEVVKDNAEVIATSQRQTFQGLMEELGQGIEAFDFCMILRNLENWVRTLSWICKTGSLNQPKLSRINLLKDLGIN